MAKDKSKGPILGAKLIDEIRLENESVRMPTYEDLMATYGRSPRGHRIVQGIEALLIERESYRVALNAIVQHQEIIGGSMADYSTTRMIAKRALR